MKYNPSKKIIIRLHGSIGDKWHDLYKLLRRDGDDGKRKIVARDWDALYYKKKTIHILSATEAMSYTGRKPDKIKNFDPHYNKAAVAYLEGL